MANSRAARNCMLHFKAQCYSSASLGKSQHACLGQFACLGAICGSAQWLLPVPGLGVTLGGSRGPYIVLGTEVGSAMHTANTATLSDIPKLYLSIPALFVNDPPKEHFLLGNAKEVLHSSFVYFWCVCVCVGGLQMPGIETGSLMCKANFQPIVSGSQQPCLVF